MTDTTTRPTRALVLGGGGVAGIAWESGLLIGLMEAGVDLEAADLVVGTSAGSSVGVMLRHGLLTTEHLQEVLAASEAVEERTNDDAGLPQTEGSQSYSSTAFADAKLDATRGVTEEQDVRAKLGEWGRARPVDLPEETWVAQIAARLPRDWPEGRLAITAVNAADGSFHTFGAQDGVELARAVAASCTLPTVFPLVTIDGDPYMDGGMRSATNADAAAGHDRVLVVACSDEGAASPFGPVLAQAAERMRNESSDVFTIEADAASRTAFGPNVLDPASIEPSFLAGLAQAQAVAADVVAFWG
ncbi:patatin-like phospholipase family protein [Mobilicoccus pelagius]|uniref:PNPLA domain-containing protein n=1 Tax=Mobilicoccus pelagius NBRC 104925 TaxID=1089455 RepID=H5UR15_9MICO|nr:patatin-like phospholipase family protein [Mobilicoccus pelagius]GAB48173.1 hypothetical protein MOPEL_067_00220 [Mobilicoccus pelagius NBRC 104925]